MFYNARFKGVLLVCMAEPFRYVTNNIENDIGLGPRFSLVKNLKKGNKISGSVQWSLFLCPKDQVPKAQGYDPC